MEQRLKPLRDEFHAVLDKLAPFARKGERAYGQTR